MKSCIFFTALLLLFACNCKVETSQSFLIKSRGTFLGIEKDSFFLNDTYAFFDSAIYHRFSIKNISESNLYILSYKNSAILPVEYVQEYIRLDTMLRKSSFSISNINKGEFKTIKPKDSLSIFIDALINKKTTDIGIPLLVTHDTSKISKREVIISLNEL